MEDSHWQYALKTKKKQNRKVLYHGRDPGYSSLLCIILRQNNCSMNLYFTKYFSYGLGMKGFLKRQKIT